MKVRHFEFSGREAVGIALLLILSFSAASFMPRQFLEDRAYETAYQVREHLAGSPAPFFIQLTSLAYNAFALLLTGTTAFNPELLSSLLMAAPPLTAALTSLFAYLALRERRFAPFPSLAAALIFASAPLLILMSSAGAYSSQPLALLLCSAALLSLSEKSIARSLLSGLLLALAALVSPASLAFSAALLAATALAGAGREHLLPTAALALPPIAALILSPTMLASLAPTSDIGSLYTDFKLSLPLALASLAALMKHGEKRQHINSLALLLLAFPAGIFIPLAAPLLLLLPAALGATILLSNENSREEDALAWFAFLFAFALSFLVPGSEPLRAALIAALFSASVLALLYLYKFKYHLVPFSALCLVLTLSLSSALAIAGSPSLQSQNVRGFAYSAINPDTAAALSWVRGNTPKGANIAFIGEKGPFLFLSERRLVEKNDARLAQFLSSSAPSSSLGDAGVDYIIATVDIFDRPERIRSLSDSNFNPESYSYLTTLFSQGLPSAAVFQSRSADILLMPLDEQGQLRAANAEIRDRELNLVATVPFSQLKLLDASAPYSDSRNRVIRPGASYATNAFGIYFEDVDGLERAYSKGSAIVLRVKR